MWEIKKIIHKGDYEYALVPDHPNATKNGYVLLHRVVMENYIGRLLTPDEVVHHKDHNKKNNDISNLELLTSKEHFRLHSNEKPNTYLILKCPQCGKIFNMRHYKVVSIYGCARYKCCSRHCSGKFKSRIRLYGITPEIQKAIDDNIVAAYTIRHDQMPLHDENYNGDLKD